jgi:hypothetical protein
VSPFTESSPADQHRVASDQLVAIAEQVSDWDAPTPVREWVARDIPEHLTWLGGFLGRSGGERGHTPSASPRVGPGPLDDPAAQVRASGQFGTPQPVAGDAPIQERLIALLGRDPHWSPEV